MDDIRGWLARVTAPLHTRVDAAAAAFDLSTDEGAGAFIALMARGVRPVERALDNAGAAAIFPEWPSRRRSHTLPRCADGPEPTFGSAAEVWGALYVLEGSRLGGRLLSRAPRLAAHPFFADAADRTAWPLFLARLEDADRALVDRPGMAAGAAAAFAAFFSNNAEGALCHSRSLGVQDRVHTLRHVRRSS